MHAAYMVNVYKIWKVSLMAIELLPLRQGLSEEIRQNGEKKSCPIWSSQAQADAWLFRPKTEQPKLWYSSRAGGVFARPRPGGGLPLLDASTNLQLRIALSRTIFKLNRSGKFPLITGLDDLNWLESRPLDTLAQIDELLLCVEQLSGPITEPTRWALMQCDEKVAEFTELCMAATRCRAYPELLQLVDFTVEQGFLLKRHGNDCQDETWYPYVGIGIGYQGGTRYLLSKEGVTRCNWLNSTGADSA